MANVVLIGIIWQLLGLDLEPVKAVLRQEFARKPEFIEPNLACLVRGYQEQLPEIEKVSLPFTLVPVREADALLTGNALLSLGAIAAGVRAFYAYPMTPSSSILGYLSAAYHETGMLVKQVEDEISVAEMAIGSMYAGTRTLVATSGGGYDLMTESVTLAAMTETPFVCVIGQRPGPATGLPTWTAAGDLNVAVYGGHGEYARCVIAISDPESAYTVIQHAFNLAEKYQTVVLVLTEKQIAESLFQLTDLPTDLPIERGLVPADRLGELKPSDRYQITETGISPRWLPGQADATFDANGDEHQADGSLTEEAEPSKAMYDKRLRKLTTLQQELPEPVLHGSSTAPILFVGWGSPKNTLMDVMETWNSQHPEKMFAYLHYEYVYPVKTERFVSLAAKASRVVLIENNAFGQLGALLTQGTGYRFDHRLLKYDGRPFFVEDIIEYLEQQSL
jgi:2-oxoglutarate ferredoxin oxidoreductase subunit alpha